MPIKQVVDCPEWQAVRLSLVGNWVRNHEANVAALRAYLDRKGWQPVAVRQVLNVLTGSVHRVGHTKGQASTDQLRAEVRRCWKEMLQEPYDPADPRYSVGVIGAAIHQNFPE
jgi:hypothetical protein